MSTMQRTIILLLALFGSALLLNVPITVKETARTGTDGFPVTFVLPLPYGAFVDTQKLRVVDETGTAVPSQFEVLNKYWTSTPQYLRHAMVHFQPSVSAWNGTAASGIKKYFVRDDGQAASPSTPVTVQDASDATTIVTGPLKFVLRKTAFTVINELWFDANENGNFEDNEKIISHNTNNGGVFVERDGTSTQLDSERTDLTWEVEESGPLRAVIRVDYPTLYSGTAVGQLKRGAAVRLYAYAGKPFVYIDYQLQNSANVPLSWFLYFKEMNIDFSLTNFNGNRVRVGMADKSVYEKSGANPDVRLFQHELLKGDLYDGGSIVKSVNNQSNFVWLSLQDTSSNVAVTSTIRHFWERWPNALQASGNKMSVQLFPKGSGTWTNIQKPWGINPAGLYYLPDMSHYYKESFLYFHKADVSSDSVTSLIKLFHNPPVAVVPTSWYAQAKATLDFGGAVPIDAPSVPTDVRMYKEKPSFDTHNMVTFGDNDGLYRAKSCTTGGWPYSAAFMIASEDPADYFDARNVLMAEINLRPQWIAKYDYFRDYPNGIKLTENPYCGGTWRQFLGNGVPILTANLINATGGVMGARDDEHGWFHHAEEAYYLTGNLWYKDWMKFISQFRQVRLHQRDPYPDMSHRALGHSLQHAISSFRVTGDIRVLDQMAVYLRNYVVPTTNPYYGDAPTAGYQTGYISRWNANYWQELSYGASSNATYAQYMAEAFGNLYGMIDWNYQYGDFPYYRNRTQYPNSISTGPGLTLVDPELFVYLITGHDWFVNHTFKYVRSGLNGGQRPDGNFKTWIGQYENRIYYRLYNNYTRADKQPPIKVKDLVAYRKAGDSRTIFRWTPVPEAVRYHGVYCTRPIVEAASFDQSVCNWWAGKAIGVPFGAGPFYQDSQYQYFYVDTNATLPAYIALFSFDDASNMSPMSNVAQASETVLTLPEASYVVIPMTYVDPGNGGNNNDSPSGGGSSTPDNTNVVASIGVSVNASLLSIAALLLLTFF